jgi:hypothetical protein
MNQMNAGHGEASSIQRLTLHISLSHDSGEAHVNTPLSVLLSGTAGVTLGDFPLRQFAEIISAAIRYI